MRAHRRHSHRVRPQLTVQPRLSSAVAPNTRCSTHAQPFHIGVTQQHGEHLLGSAMALVATEVSGDSTVRPVRLCSRGRAVRMAWSG